MRQIVVTPYLRADQAKVFDSAPSYLFVGTRMAQHPEILPHLIEQDRERLIQEQE